MTIRVRFAPSPTGYMHIGSLRTVLYNYFFARKHGGAFLLRIEDTDRARTVPNGVQNILDTLKAMGLDYDEKPVIQSSRLAIYQKHAEELVAAGRAFYCYCTPDELDAMRAEQEAKKLPPRYNGKCLDTKPQGGSHVVRLLVPETGETVFKDMIRGEVKIQNAQLDHAILMKTDGFPTYHLANVVDDHLMQITHVIRGEEWISSTPKHVLLYDAFGWQPPKFAHLPLLLNPDRSKLSKRQADVAVEDYLAKGYLPDALINFVSLLGWNPTADREIYTRDELIKSFDLEGVNKSGAVVNFEKLDWMNGQYLRKLTTDQLTNLVRPYVERAGYHRVTDETLGKIVELERERLQVLGQFAEETSYFFAHIHYDPKLLIWKKTSAEKTRDNLQALAVYLNGVGEREFADASVLESGLKSWIITAGLQTGEILSPMRVALTGREKSPPPFAIASILGKGETLARINKAIEML